MSTPQKRIETEIRIALKAGEKEKLSTLRMLLAAIKNERISRGEELDETAFLGVVRKSVKERRESAEQYRAGNREELAAKEEREIEILSAHLPPEIGEDDLRAAVLAIVADLGLEGPAAIGQVMREMMSRYQGRADGGVISRIAREILSTGG
jgi:uncharacterized protein YqeY